MQEDGRFKIRKAQGAKKMEKNKKYGPMLNAYPDSIEGNLAQMVNFLRKPEIASIFQMFYILPSVFNSDLDRGFSIIDYQLNDSYAKGTDLEEVKELGMGLKLDFVLNHISVQSPQFQDIIQNGLDSKYRDFFINWNEFWEGAGELTEEGFIQPDEKYLKKMFFRKPGLPLLMVKMPDGSIVPYWNTFYQQVLDDGYLGQMDLNVKSPLVWEYYEEVLKQLADYGSKIVRLDAFAYAHKEVGEANFMNESGTWDLLSKVEHIAQKYHLELLPEIHSSYEDKTHEVLSEKGYLIYDFFLPGLLIDAIENGNLEHIKEWAGEIVNKKMRTINMLGCHDGIPLLDLKGILTEEEIQNLIRLIVSRGGYVKNLHGQKNMYYQVNATYYSALGNDDRKMLLARAIQVFMPGIPQVWYLDLFVGKNDYEAVERAGEGGHKEINRTNLSMEYIEEGLQLEVVKKQLQILEFRSHFEAFHPEGDFEIIARDDMTSFIWTYKDKKAVLDVDICNLGFTITAVVGEKEKVIIQQI